MSHNFKKPVFTVTEILSGRLRSSGGVTTPAMLYGTLLHSAIEYYLTHLKTADYSEELTKTNKSVDDFNKEFLHCIKLLAKLFGDDFVSKAKVVLEKRFIQEFDNYYISGKPDLILEYNGFKYVVDFKTDANIFKSTAKYKMQLSAYNMLVGGGYGAIINTKYFNFIQTKGLELEINKNKFLQKAEEFYLKNTAV